MTNDDAITGKILDLNEKLSEAKGNLAHIELVARIERVEVKRLESQLEIAMLEFEKLPTEFEVRLTGVPVASTGSWGKATINGRIGAIKAVREVCKSINFGLKEAKDLVDLVVAGTPQVVLEGLTQDAANSAAQILRAAGCAVQVEGFVPAPGPSYPHC